MIHWQEQRDEAVRAIESRTSAFKILLKTKDDPYFLERWIRHHAGIVGLENLIVFDNDSTDPEALRILQAFQPELLVLRFTGPHNLLHWVKASSDLYRALSRSCRHFVFLDTDESLVLFRGHHHYATPAIVDFIHQYPDASVIPSVWLWSIPRHIDVFSFGPNFSGLSDGIRHGKPILQASPKLHGLLCHNCHVPRRLYSSALPVGLFVLHRAMLSPSQRMKANVKKLVARKWIRETDSIADIIELGKQLGMAGSVGGFFLDIEALKDQPEPDPDRVESLSPHQFSLRPDGTVEYFSRNEMLTMFRFLMKGNQRIRAALKLDTPSVYNSAISPPHLGGSDS